jgi:hypothetical protein
MNGMRKIFALMMAALMLAAFALPATAGTKEVTLSNTLNKPAVLGATLVAG